MAFNEVLAQQVRDHLSAYPELSERKMFGGMCFMLQGNMCCGVVEDQILLRINGPMYDELLDKPEISMMDMTRKPMRGFLYVAAEAIKQPEQRQHWLSYAIDYCLSLPPK